MKLEHIGIAVKDLHTSNELFSRLLGDNPYKSEFVQSESVTTSFFLAGESKIELLASDTDHSTIAKYINKKGEGVHHLAFGVDDIHMEMKRLKEAGFELIHDEPERGADNKLICFLHPKSTNGVLVELCQDIKQ